MLCLLVILMNRRVGRGGACESAGAQLLSRENVGSISIAPIPWCTGKKGDIQECRCDSDSNLPEFYGTGFLKRPWSWIWGHDWGARRNTVCQFFLHTHLLHDSQTSGYVPHKTVATLEISNSPAIAYGSYEKPSYVAMPAEIAVLLLLGLY